MKHLIVLAALVVVSACGSNEETAGASGAASAPAEGAGGAVAGGDGDSNFGTVTLAPGFTAPSAAEGRAGGSTDAATLNAECVGNIADTPDHLLELSADMENLRVFASSEADITLVVQRPDDTFLCNDDSEGLNPLVHAEAWPAGLYKVWIGNYDASEGGASYRLGFSTADDAAPSQLAN